MAWRSPAATAAIVAIVVLAFLVVMGFMIAFSSPFGFVGFMFVPFCGVFIVIIIVVALAMTQGSMHTGIPPPPPIQQPMVPAGTPGVIALNCPNCGAPPQNVDRFGVATCTYCNTRFLVR